MAQKLDKLALLKKLEGIEYEKDDERDQDVANRVNLGGHLLLLADLDHNRQYELCRKLAEHLLEIVPEPDEIDTDEE
jgi:hypothetical protein